MKQEQQMFWQSLPLLSLTDENHSKKLDITYETGISYQESMNNTIRFAGRIFFSISNTDSKTGMKCVLKMKYPEIYKYKKQLNSLYREDISDFNCYGINDSNINTSKTNNKKNNEQYKIELILNSEQKVNRKSSDVIILDQPNFSVFVKCIEDIVDDWNSTNINLTNNSYFQMMMNMMINNNNDVLKNMTEEISSLFYTKITPAYENSIEKISIENNNSNDEREYLDENNEPVESSKENMGERFNLIDYEEKSKEIVDEELSGVKVENEDRETNTGDSEVDNYIDKLIPEYHKDISNLINILNDNKIKITKMKNSAYEKFTNIFPCDLESSNNFKFDLLFIKNLYYLKNKFNKKENLTFEYFYPSDYSLNIKNKKDNLRNLIYPLTSMVLLGSCVGNLYKYLDMGDKYFEDEKIPENYTTYRDVSYILKFIYGNIVKQILNDESNRKLFLEELGINYDIKNLNDNSIIKDVFEEISNSLFYNEIKTVYENSIEKKFINSFERFSQVFLSTLRKIDKTEIIDENNLILYFEKIELKMKEYNINSYLENYLLIRVLYKLSDNKEMVHNQTQKVIDQLQTKINENIKKYKTIDELVNELNTEIENDTKLEEWDSFNTDILDDEDELDI